MLTLNFWMFRKPVYVRAVQITRRITFPIFLIVGAYSGLVVNRFCKGHCIPRSLFFYGKPIFKEVCGLKRLTFVFGFFLQYL